MGNRLLFFYYFLFSVLSSRDIQRKNLRKDLIIVESFETDRAGPAGGHAKTASLAQHRIDLGLTRKRHIFFSI